MLDSSLSFSSPRSSGHAAATVVATTIVFLGIAALLIAIVVLIAGGFVIDAGPLHVSFRHWTRPATLSLIAWAICTSVASLRRNTGAAVEVLSDVIQRQISSIAVIVAAAAAACGIAYGTYAASGSDAAGYIAEAELLAQGRVAYDEPLARQVDWLDATATFAPLAFRPALAPGARLPTPGRLAPTYPPGLPLTMTLPRVVAEATGPFLVAPLLGAASVLATFLLARRIHSPIAGMVAAVLLASSPIFLFEIVQPMSDVPSTAWWVLALVLALNASDIQTAPRAATMALLSGIAAGMAVLTRPNLVPLIVPVFVALYLKADTASAEESPVRRNADPAPATHAVPTPRTRTLATIAFAAGSIPCAATLAWLQWKMYGSPLASGYGPAAFHDFFSLANVAPNARDYTNRMLAGELPALSLACVAVAALTVARRVRLRRIGRAASATGVHRGLRAHGIMLAVVVATIVLCYLPYGVFPDWWYLRFLLPALPMAFSLIAIAVARAQAELPRPVRGVVLLTALTVVCSSNVVIARHQQAFLLRAAEARYQLAGEYLAAMAPSNAVIVTVQDSAAVHVYTHLPILRWDLLPIDLDAALAQLTALGRRPLLLVEEWERSQLRAKFPSSAAARLDWAPIADFGDPVRIGLFDPVNRATSTDRVH